MANKKSKGFNLNKALPVLIPVLIAAIVVSAFAISGRVDKSVNDNNPNRTTVATTTTKPQHTKVELIAVGDNLIHMPVVNSGKQEDGSYNFDYMYEPFRKYVEAADIACINQETRLGGSSFPYKGYPMFNSPQEIGEAAINAGFDVFTLATNHSMDVKAAGIEKEIEFFNKHPDVIHIGTNLTMDDYNKITYSEKNGIKFAYLNYTYGTNGIPIPEDKPYLVNLLREEKVTKDITEARKNADIVIVFPHWGTENSHEINEEQKKYVQLFSKLGVDIVIGTHPHVIQPVQWVTNPETGKKMLVYYSIGNFLSRQIELNQMCGGMAEITIEKNNETVSITNAKFAPTIDYYTQTDDGLKFGVYKYCDYTPELAKKQVQSGATVDYFTNLSKKYISEEFLDLN
ncbi:MAG: CapA family protein [Eubacterium sp.]|nr:CapA family protein [Eubacterium sp.]